MKYLVVKGWLGFGDRLESLKMCVKYALDNKLPIYVDWTDSIWSHGTESFYSYFKLNMPTFSLDDIPADATYYPEFWKDNIKTPMSHELSSRKELNLNQLKGTYPADVIVYSSVGNRTLYNNSLFFADTFQVIHPIIIQQTKQRQANLKNTIGVHIRGTDRLNRKGRETPIQWMAISAMNNGAFNGKQLVAVSDDSASLEVWKRFFPQTVVASSLSIQNLKQGNHNAKKEDLKVSKDEMNIDMLVDFFTLASCETAISTYKDSRFFQESRRLAPYVSKILS